VNQRFVHYYPKAVLEHSGVTHSLWNWAEAIVRMSGCEALVLHAGGPFRDEYSRSPVRERGIKHFGSSRPSYLPVDVGRHLRRGDVLVLHDGWVNSNIAAAWAAHRKGIPYVVMPHGAYEPALLKAVKFERSRGVLESWMLRNALAVHVFYESERELVQRFAPGQRNFVVAHNGIGQAPVRWRGGGGYLSWFGRMDVHHKGLDLLVQALATLPRAERPHVRLHGYDYKGGLSRVQELVRMHGVGSHLTVGPAVQGDAKWELIRDTDGYVHLSRWESASIALLEHMSAGTPMLLSRSTRMAPALEQKGLAILTSLDPVQIGRSLTDLPSRGRSSSEALRAYTADNFSWDVVAQRFVDQIEPLLEAR
jgi:glycosyltransferase involved in cell wall biosynthesis